MNVDDVAPIAQTVRNGMVESVHHGIVLAVRGDGRVELAVGNGDAAVYPRSALKPLQAEAMLGAGLALDRRLLAVACASHSGEPQHVAVVREILAGAGLDESALQNTPDLPLSADAMADVLRAGGGRTPILQNCSGKHAAMLATCVVNGWPRDGYLAADHPVQRAIARTIGDLTGGVLHTGVDGCGAPTAMVGLRGIGGAFRRLAAGGCDSYRAMVAHPVLVAGTERDDTIVMGAIPDLLVKGGAEGVVVAAHPDGRFVAIKVADGAERARTAVLRVALAALDFDVERLPPAPILGHGRPVGVVESLVR